MGTASLPQTRPRTSPGQVSEAATVSTPPLGELEEQRGSWSLYSPPVYI